MLQLWLVTPSFRKPFYLFSKVMILDKFFALLYFHSMINWKGKIHQLTNSFHLVIEFFVWSSGHDWGIRLNFKGSENFMFSFSRTDSYLRIYYLSVWPNFILPNNSRWITILTSRVNSYIPSESLILWLTLSSLTALAFRCVLSSFALILAVLNVLFCTANLRDLVSLLRFPLRNHA